MTDISDLLHFSAITEAAAVSVMLCRETCLYLRVVVVLLKLTYNKLNQALKSLIFFIFYFFLQMHSHNT